LVFPEIVPNETISGPAVRILKYPGIKEDVYVPNFRPDHGLRARLGVDKNDLLITVRPPATEAHYHNPQSEVLFAEVLRTFSGKPGVKMLLLPRNKRQEHELRQTWADEIASGHILIPNHIEDGLNIIWNSDLVISGGGTMNREAAALGVPVYSIFRGPTGAVDRYLSEKGRLIMLETVDDVQSKVLLTQHSTPADFLSENRPALQTIISYIEAILGSRDPSTTPTTCEVMHTH
jgi:predicted glycosyltransferase